MNDNTNVINMDASVYEELLRDTYTSSKITSFFISFREAREGNLPPSKKVKGKEGVSKKKEVRTTYIT